MRPEKSKYEATHKEESRGDNQGRGCVKADLITVEQEREAAQTRVSLRCGSECGIWAPEHFVNVNVFCIILKSLIVFCCATYSSSSSVVKNVIQMLSCVIYIFAACKLKVWFSTHLWERPNSVSICASLRVPLFCFSYELGSFLQPGPPPSSQFPVRSQSQSLTDRRCWACHCSAHRSPPCSPGLAGSDDTTAGKGSHYN